MESGTITRRMDSILDGLQSEFRAMLNTEDFRNKLAALKKSANKSDRASKLRVLFDMFDECRIPYERGQSDAYYEKLIQEADIPEFSEMEDRMIYALYQVYQDYPDPTEFMQRIVRRLNNPADHWEDDPLRLQILKQFVKYGSCLTYTSIEPDADGTLKKQKNVIYGGEGYLKKYIAKKTGKPVKDLALVLDLITDDVFDVLPDADKEQRKPKGTYGILKMADDLASGKFRGEGSTKRSLYLFAMVYDMTFYSGSPVQIIDPRTDLEKNLFQDYYTNNLMRFISDAYKGKLSEYELDPSGQGINYKNFAEIIYLYYLSSDYSPAEKIRRSDVMIRRVQQIQREEGGWTRTAGRQGTAYYRNLVRNEEKDLLLADEVFNLREEQFETFILQNYNCDTYNGTYETSKRKVGDLQLEMEQNTAFAVYQSILDDLVDVLNDFASDPDELDEEKEELLSTCNYGLWFADVAAFRKKGIANISHRRDDIDEAKFGEFMDLLAGVNSFMGYTGNEEISGQSVKQEWTETSRSKTKALFVTSPQSVTRTSIIVAYYYYYNAFHEEDGDDYWRSFEELFLDFKRGVDEKLVSAYYQPLSGKNIFDVLVTFSSYAYLNI